MHSTVIATNRGFKGVEETWVRAICRTCRWKGERHTVETSTDFAYATAAASVEAEEHAAEEGEDVHDAPDG